MQIPIYAKYLGLIAAGQKTMEGRLCTSLWRNMQVGQSVTFFDRRSDHRVEVEIESVHRHPDFEDMLRSHGVQQFLPDRRENDVWGAVSVYHSFPGYQRRVQEVGACAIGFRLKENDPPKEQDDDMNDMDPPKEDDATASGVAPSTITKRNGRREHKKKIRKQR